MSLSDSLEQILDWHRRNDTPAARLMQPGLSEDDILRALKDVPFKLPGEFIDLYRWRNGVPGGGDAQDTSFFDFHRFLPLEEALSNFQASYGIMKEFYELTDWVQVFMDPAGDGYGLSGGPSRLDTAPVVFLFEGEGVRVVFESLGRMMETVAACFEQGVMTWQEGQLETDYFAWGETAHRLNPAVQYWRDYVRGT